jgi:hypothetical protein
MQEAIETAIQIAVHNWIQKDQKEPKSMLNSGREEEKGKKKLLFWLTQIDSVRDHLLAVVAFVNWVDMDTGWHGLAKLPEME